jgi:hypothetical protein
MTIAEEAQRYLEVVEFFRSQGCEPHWRPEPQIGRPRPRRAAHARAFDPAERRKGCSS